MSPKKPRDTSKWVTSNPEFQRILGLFHGLHSATNMTVDYAIGRFLKVPPTEAHLITSGIMFGKKCRLLADLISRSDHPNKAAILDAFNKVRGGKRDVIAHSYVWSNSQMVKFIERQSGGEFKAVEHEFSFDSFSSYVIKYANDCTTFYNLLETSIEEIEQFANAAFSLNRKSTKSPVRPTSKR